MTLLSLILDYLLGRKYYLLVLNRVGTGYCEVSSNIFPTIEAAEEARNSLHYNNKTYEPIDIVSFRCRTALPDYYGQN